MSFDDGDEPTFDHLDDPAPPSLGMGALTSVVARGQQIRRRRRLTYAATSAAVVVVLAGAAITVAGASKHGHAQPVDELSNPANPTSTSQSASAHPADTSTKRGGTIFPTGGNTGFQRHHRSGNPASPVGGGPTTPTPCQSTVPVTPTSPAVPTYTPSAGPTDSSTSSADPSETTDSAGPDTASVRQRVTVVGVRCASTPPTDIAPSDGSAGSTPPSDATTP